MHSTIVDEVDVFAGNLQLFERMEAALEMRLQIVLDDEKLRKQLAKCKRQLGKLDEAQALYKNLHLDVPENPDYHFAAMALKGALEGSLPNGITSPNPSPIIGWYDFLSTSTIKETLDYICEHRDEFLPAKLNKNGKDHYDASVRNNTDLSLKGHPLKINIQQRLRPHIPDLTRRLGLQPFVAEKIKVQLRAYHHGQYFRTHHDSTKGRVINFVFFFHPEPRCFAGGDLVIYDTDIKSSTYNNSFSRIIPKHNYIVFFPSNYYHAVLPVETKDDDFLSGRFVINGHICMKEE